MGVPAEYFAEGLDAEVRAAIESGIDRVEGGRLHGEAGFAAAHALRGPDVLPGCHG